MTDTTPRISAARRQDEPTRRVGGSLDPLFHHVLGPLAGSLTAGLAAAEAHATVEVGVLSFLALLCSTLVFDPESRWSGLLPFMRIAKAATAPMLGFVVLAALNGAIGLPGLELVELVWAFAAATLVSLVPEVFSRRYWRAERGIRTAVIGSPHAADSLARELGLAGVTKYAVVGRIAVGDDDAEGEVPVIGRLGDLGDTVADHGIHLLIMSGEVPRLTIFDEVAASCLHLPVRLWELSGFYEEVFGHVPVAEINASWFQYIMHPRYRAAAPAGKRVLDVVAAIVLGTVLLPVMAIFALLIKRDGGPVLFRQVRIGEGGQPFTVYKLRTMQLGSPSAAQWAEFDDPRVTAIGRLLRRSHLDEVPNLLNVLKGEMSLVGPRPEQPEFVDRLETLVPYYQRRHLLKPGITGWAQVRCGYAGSDLGSAWKLCHDLFYLKHRSLTLDFIILGETIRTLFADRQYAVEPNDVSFILGSERAVGEGAPAVAGTG